MHRAERAADPGRLVVVGLGNPGPRYEQTRHNAGALAVGVVAERVAAPFRRHKSGCLAAEIRLADRPAVLARPLRYMNESGLSVRELVRWYHAELANLVVVHDEIDLPFGTVRVKRGGGTAGHNGLRSVVDHLGSAHFGRVRIGVSRPRGRRDAADWVLDEFSSSERRDLPGLLGRAADAVERIAADGLDATMNEFNVRRASE